MQDLIAAILMVLQLAGGGSAPLAPLTYRLQAGVFGEAQSTLGLLRFVLIGMSREPSDRELDAAVRMFWQRAGLNVSATAKLACYPWDGAYKGQGRPMVCRYSLVFDGRRQAAPPPSRDSTTTAPIIGI